MIKWYLATSCSLCRKTCKDFVKLRQALRAPACAATHLFRDLRVSRPVKYDYGRTVWRAFRARSIKRSGRSLKK
ncbi:hypothetical protein [Alloprevotella tannerae]|uniref:hypothetical protein n=1 Tax=Alloprevotella tannerae TaxID=76122 RepID=UPI0028E6F8AB|nr:hypothetical protein [Alloprevotella tannerae]